MEALSEERRAAIAVRKFPRRPRGREDFDGGKSLRLMRLFFFFKSGGASRHLTPLRGHGLEAQPLNLALFEIFEAS